MNELRVDAGDKQNEATVDLPGAPANTPNPDDARRILQSIRDARQHADVVIVYQHNHVFANHSFSTIFTEGMPERLAPNEWLRKWTHAEIDAGADIIVMHGAPLLHGVEIYHGRPIFYDLGNFIYNLPPTLTYIDEPMNWESAVASVEFEGKMLKSISFRPIVLNTSAKASPTCTIRTPTTSSCTRAACPRRRRARERATSCSGWPTRQSRSARRSK